MAKPGIDGFLLNLKNKFRRSFLEIGLSSESVYLDKYKETVKAINNKVPIIYQGVLHNTHDNTFGSPDLIIRSDYINKIFNYSDNTLTCTNIHYVIVDIKCSTLEMNADGKTLRKSPGHDYFKTQILTLIFCEFGRSPWFSHVTKINISRDIERV